MNRAVLVSLVTAVVLTSTAAFARSTLQGTVRDADTREPIPFVTVTMDTVEVRLTSSEGFFDFGEVPDGRHVIVFDHIAYQRRVVTVDWPDDDMPLRVTMEPAQFEMEKIVVEAERVLPSYPVGAVSVSRQEVTTVPGNIANDPMRTIQ
ncbi:MAG: carboxypeptidase-like regulatory domain-containing protein, partial [Gemmatimonadales bacterium]